MPRACSPTSATGCSSSTRRGCRATLEPGGRGNHWAFQPRRRRAERVRRDPRLGRARTVGSRGALAAPVEGPRRSASSCRNGSSGCRSRASASTRGSCTLPRPDRRARAREDEDGLRLHHLARAAHAARGDLRLRVDAEAGRRQPDGGAADGVARRDRRRGGPPRSNRQRRALGESPRLGTIASRSTSATPPRSCATSSSFTGSIRPARSSSCSRPSRAHACLPTRTASGRCSTTSSRTPSSTPRRRAGRGDAGDRIRFRISDEESAFRWQSGSGSSRSSPARPGAHSRRRRHGPRAVHLPRAGAAHGRPDLGRGAERPRLVVRHRAPAAPRPRKLEREPRAARSRAS